MNILIKNISEYELEDFVSILNEAVLWLKDEGMEMWNGSQLTTQTLLKNNALEELFMGYINNQSAAVMILQEEDSIF